MSPTPCKKTEKRYFTRRTLAWCGMVGMMISPLRADEIPPTPNDQAIATIIETKPICREPGKYPGQGSEFGYNDHGHPKTLKTVIEDERYLGWATIAKTRAGELIVAFSGDRDSHVDPWGKTQIIRSLDQGKTWSKEETITNSPLDDRDAGIIQTKKGTLVVSWFTSIVAINNDPRFPGAYDRYRRHGEKLTQEIRDQWLGNWTRRSEDNGKTWEKPVRTIGTAPHGPISLHDGRLLYMGLATFDGKPEVSIEESKDDGRSWQLISRIPKPADLLPGWSEPHIVELKSGKIIGMIRYQPRPGPHHLLQTESTDGGKTWSPVHSTGIWGLPPHIIQLKNGWLVMAYGYRKPPYGERACISRDEGKTWDLKNEVLLTGAPGQDLGYPSSVELDDGSILTVYYQPEKYGQPTFLWSTHWKLKEK